MLHPKVEQQMEESDEEEEEEAQTKVPMILSNS